ncbi:MAG TPA: neutral zinc metallopeptidase, partial [Gemmataceae bacterium]|jgi:predicted metalloprotease|nr:neutral zinc metallopeptidase [Gemmataceae bacterium]
MQWEGREESENVEDTRGMGGGGRGLMIGGGGVVGVIVVILGLIFGVDVGKFRGGGGGPAPDGPAGPRDPDEDRMAKFSKVIFRDTEVVWDQQFAKLNKRYDKPVLRLFTDQVDTRCGPADSGVGPFYCPADSRVYIDLSFFEVLERDLKSGGEFARAYVIAHEVGHHVQRLLGYSARVDQARQRGSKREANEMSVRLELQADFLAGVWAHHGQKQFNFLEPGDIESATNAAYHIGDDYLQKRSGRRPVPESFTHGTSAQRQRWFMDGFKTGDVRRAALLFDMPYNQL